MTNEVNNATVKLLAILLVVSIIFGTFVFLYTEENNEILKGEANFQLHYIYTLKNEGPLNLSFVSLRLALLKSWEPVQRVDSISYAPMANRTASDQYNNSFIYYEFDFFGVNQTLQVEVYANLTLYLLDYANAKLTIYPYDPNDRLYALFLAYDQYADTTDPAVRSIANSFPVTNNPIEDAYYAYNFSSTFIKYKLLSKVKGASFAIRNGYGDCDEYTTLFMALTRARGIPSIEHSAWLGDFVEGYNGTDNGAAAHAYPMFYVNGIGMLPADPTRGNTNFFENWLKTDEKRITLTRGPDKPYRHLTYRWIPKENISDPQIFSEYRIFIDKLNINYFSRIRTTIFVILTAMPVVFVGYSAIAGRRAYKLKQEKVKKILMDHLTDN